MRGYFVRIATTGSMPAAIDAGTIPATKPMITQILTASNKMLDAIKIGKGIIAVAIKVAIQTKNKPNAPPMIQRNALSNKNSVRMVLFFAPIAFLIF